MEDALTQIFQLANGLVFVAMGVFARVGAAAFFVPGLGERYLPMRLRLGAALALTFMLVPMIRPLADTAPPVPWTLVQLTAILAAEAVVGLIIGLAFRMLVYALQIAGMAAAQHLSVAQMFGAGVSPDPEPTIATILAMGGIVLAMMAGMHIHLLTTLVEYYDVFPFGTFPSGEDVADWATRRVAETFALGITLAAPFVAVGFAYNLALGALNRAMPQLLVALVGVPGLVWIGLVILALVLPTVMDEWMMRAARVFDDPLGGVR